MTGILDWPDIKGFTFYVLLRRTEIAGFITLFTLVRNGSQDSRREVSNSPIYTKHCRR